MAIDEAWAEVMGPKSGPESGEERGARGEAWQSGSSHLRVSERLSRYTNPGQVDENTIARWRPVIEREGDPNCKILTVRSLLTAPTRIVVDNIVWEVHPVEVGETLEVPDWVQARFQRFDRSGMPIIQMIYGDEILPQFALRTSARLDPQGLGFAHQGPTPSPETWPQQTWPQRDSFWQAFLRFFGLSTSQSQSRIERYLDPILIWVIPTLPGRGVWVEVGAWFHEAAQHGALLGPTR